MSYPIPALALLVLLPLGTLVPAHAQTFGRTEVGDIPSAGMTANAKRGSKFTPAEPGTAHTICFHVDGNGGASGFQDFRLALYSDKAGVPDAKLAETDQTFFFSGQGRAWNCRNIGWVPVTTVPYWIVIHSGDTGGVVRYYGGGPANWFGNNVDAFSDGASNTFGSGNSGAGTLSVYAVYTPASQLENSGRTTIGTKPSVGMTANFKRGSSFTASGPGRLSALTAYVDKLGGAAGTQRMRMAVYRDADGRPGARISQSGEAVLPAGSWGRWITLPTEPTTFEAGRYWIVMHTGTTGGVLRNFADGSGNWFGNADSYDDGPSPAFGAGTSGNGTISAFASYEPGPFVIRRLGRTDIGTKPSQGLTANFIRGGVFELNDPPAILTGLHAYLDGNGGASGAQKVRMVVYGLNGTGPNFTGFKMAESAEVSIAAGTPPGWVRFPVALTNLQLTVLPVFLITLHSGDTGGIVRAYGGDGPANWLGIADDYANGADHFEVGQAIAGNGTLSMHATYSTPAD